MKLRLALGSVVAFLFASAVAAQPADDGEWRTAGKDPGLNRFSGLAQIHTGNAAQLKLAFHFPTNLDRGHEAAPIVAENTMIVVGPFPNLVYAFDVSKAPFTQKWAFDPKPDSSSQGVACCDVVNRG